MKGILAIVVAIVILPFVAIGFVAGMVFYTTVAGASFVNDFVRWLAR